MTTRQVQAVAPVLPGRSSWLNRAVAALLAGLAAFFLTIVPGQSTETRAGEIGAGSLLIRGGDGVETAAVRLGTDADLTVSGPTIRARITQVFRNDTAGWVEARYVYPLPDGGAVDTLKMIAGGRLIIGNVKERRAAQAAFEQAKRDGRKAALVEQQRPNIFSNTVANIGPGETVLVQIEYQEPVHLSGDEFSLRLPLVVGPRYNPAPLVQSVDLRAADGGWGASSSDPVPDRDKITPPVNDPAVTAPINPTTITVRLQAGFPIKDVKSHHHQVTVEGPDASTRVIRLADGPVPADRDFELTWTSAAAKAPSVGLFREHVGDADYVVAYVTPPVDETPQAPLPRDVIFVIDNSGSMGGTSIAQAKASLLYALGRLASADRFNVIRFDDTMDVLFGAAVPADASHLDRARAFVTALQARGGTEMVPAMRAALTDDRADDAKGLRQVVFLTDGAIGNEQQLFDTIAQMGGRSRVFMVGIGSAPNTYLMTRASEIGRGAFTHIGSVDQVEERMRGLFAKLENPAVTSLTASFSAAKAEMTPAVLPDLYRGEPLVLAARLDKLSGALDVGGRIGERPWHVSLPLAGAVKGKGLSKLWAQRKIADAEIARTLRQIAPEEADRSILKLALTHQLVSRLTSLVAIDETPSRPNDAPLKLAELPINLPAGWDYATLMGEPTRMRALPPTVDQRRADAGRVQVADANALKLPQTATDADLKMLIGLALLAFATLAMFVNRRQLSPR